MKINKINKGKKKKDELTITEEMDELTQRKSQSREKQDHRKTIGKNPTTQ